jgi:hypothetical protein
MNRRSFLSLLMAPLALAISRPDRSSAYASMITSLRSTLGIGSPVGESGSVTIMPLARNLATITINNSINSHPVEIVSIDAGGLDGSYAVALIQKGKSS